MAMTTTQIECMKELRKFCQNEKGQADHVPADLREACIKFVDQEMTLGRGSWAYEIVKMMAPWSSAAAVQENMVPIVEKYGQLYLTVQGRMNAKPKLEIINHVCGCGGEFRKTIVGNEIYYQCSSCARKVEDLTQF